MSTYPAQPDPRLPFVLVLDGIPSGTEGFSFVAGEAECALRTEHSVLAGAVEGATWLETFPARDLPCAMVTLVARTASTELARRTVRRTARAGVAAVAFSRCSDEESCVLAPPAARIARREELVLETAGLRRDRRYALRERLVGRPPRGDCLRRTASSFDVPASTGLRSFSSRPGSGIGPPFCAGRPYRLEIVSRRGRRGPISLVRRFTFRVG